MPPGSGKLTVPSLFLSKVEPSRRGEFGTAGGTLGMKGGVNHLRVIEVVLVNCRMVFALIDS